MYYFLRNKQFFVNLCYANFCCLNYKTDLSKSCSVLALLYRFKIIIIINIIIIITQKD